MNWEKCALGKPIKRQTERRRQDKRGPRKPTQRLRKRLPGNSCVMQPTQRQKSKCLPQPKDLARP